MGIRDQFKAGAEGQAQERRDGKAAPQELFEKRIKTREMLDWMERRKPDDPSLELTPEDAASREKAVQENARLARRMRWRFHSRSQKGREDFRTAHDFGRKGRDQEQER
ncbi:hypothetical protein [uncultured Roseobacter sp.]|uniref:hypothetical protein n=1 Tax=uncultured Roseobacter sp. TaxID=114847 RepID=UPI002601EDE3|nr:hypothetical protein [uncultured Roseobacter sp.]